MADIATDDVARRLSARGIPFQRLNTEDFPFSRTLAISLKAASEKNWMSIDGGPLFVPTSIWYRRMRSPSKPDGMDDGIYNFFLGRIELPCSEES
jgi:hypothetical protein